MKDCVSQEVAKKLQEVGYKGECEKVWHCDGHRHKPILVNKDSLRYPLGVIRYPAPTATQLAEELPKKRGTNEYLVITPNSDGGWCCGYQHYDTMMIAEYAETLPNCLGLMMRYLIENKLI